MSVRGIGPVDRRASRWRRSAADAAYPCGRCLYGALDLRRRRFPRTCRLASAGRAGSPATGSPASASPRWPLAERSCPLTGLPANDSGQRRAPLASLAAPQTHQVAWARPRAWLRAWRVRPPRPSGGPLGRARLRASDGASFHLQVAPGSRRHRRPLGSAIDRQVSSTRASVLSHSRPEPVVQPRPLIRSMADA